LAFLTAATHGLNEEAELLQQQLEAACQPVPTVNPSAVFLQPPSPIAQAESNWPLLTVFKVRHCLFYTF
jgi:coatomer protein complex subunit alpha (xenin)